MRKSVVGPSAKRSCPENDGGSLKKPTKGGGDRKDGCDVAKVMKKESLVEVEWKKNTAPVPVVVVSCANHHDLDILSS